jgi:prepilin-type processing-associated H-X9-DG protein
MPRNLAFTIPEVLAVIAIIVIVVAMLLPNLSRARESANRALCASNLHQLAVATRHYLNNNKKVFPTDANGPVRSYYAWAGKRGTEYTAQERFINPYLNIDRDVNVDDNESVFQVFRCPSDNGAQAGRWNYTRAPSLFDTFGNSYFYNSSAINNSPLGLHGRKTREIRSPSAVILANDFAFGMYGWWPMLPGAADTGFQKAYWHHPTEIGWGNVAFVDGHVEYFRATYNEPDFQNGPDWTFIFDGPHN